MSADASQLTLAVRVQPGAKRNEVVGRFGEALRVRIAAPAVDGKANEALLRFLAGEFGVRRAAVSIVSGPASRSKRVRIEAPARSPAWLGQ